MIHRTLLLACMAAAIPASGQEPLSLDAALEQARLKNPELRALRERAAASTARGDSIRKQKLPRVGVELSAQRTDNPAAVFAHRLNASEFTSRDFEIARLNSPDATSHLGTSIFAEVPIDVAGRINLAADVRAAGQRVIENSLREAEAAIALQVTETYLGVVLSKQARGTIEKALAAARSREEITQARFEEGVALQADVLRVRARRRAREADLAAQDSEVSVALSMLARLIGASDGARFVLTDTARPGTIDGEMTVWKERALAARPALLAAKGNQEAAGLALRLEERTKWPELAAQARLTDDRTSWGGGGRSWAVGAFLRWNLFDGTRDKRIAAAIADQRASQEDERAARDRVRYEVESAFARVGAAFSRLAAAEGGALEGREALRVVQERRAQGLATLTDELETEAAAYAAELEEINAARRAVLAEAALRRAAGLNPGSNVQ
jgi:outer membrane protein TolC